jgi:micrococcal nuclease
MVKAALALIAAVLVVGWTSQPAPAATCADYSNQADAQRAKDTRDADGDGIYCESLPCPCLKPGQGGGGGTPTPTPKPKPRKRAQVIEARITSVVDGDTITVKAFSAKRDFYTVRLLGIDTPETKKPGTAVECGGKRATASMMRLGFTEPTDSDGDGLEDTEGGDGRRVTLTTDPTQATFDRYGRLLAYVTTKAGGNLETMQLSRGWATVYVFGGKPFQRVDRFRSVERRAHAAGRGAWKLCGGNFHTPA